ncbi:hypothetical protein NMY22_g6976 [Coprinellus aureogranulatus]|nr:hypothetical protein NMY22_g6976 [Coprinellus aureogranulatus]
MEAFNSKGAPAAPVFCEEPGEMDAGNAARPATMPPVRGSTGDSYAGLFNSGPAGPGHSPANSNDGASSGNSMLNGSSRVAIDNLHATIIGTSNVQGQQGTAPVVNIYNPSAPEERRTATLDSVIIDMFQERKNELAAKEQELNGREEGVKEQERSMAEKQRSMEKERKSFEDELRLLERRKKKMDEQERNLAQLAQRLRKLEGDLRNSEIRRKPGDPPRHVARARVSVARYGEYLTPRLRAAFGDCVLGIEDMAAQFDFTNIDLADRSEQASFYVPLAPHYCGLDKEQIEGFPDSLKVAISSVVDRVEASRTDIPFNWSSIEELMTTNKHLEFSGTAKQLNDGPIWLKEGFKPADLSVLNEWLHLLLTDGDFFSANQSLSKAKKKGATQELPTSSYDTKPLVDMLVLWFPVDDRRYFRFSRTTLKLCTTPRQGFVMGRQKIRYFLLADHHTSCSFHPRESMLWQMEKEAREAIVQGVESLIDD